MIIKTSPDKNKAMALKKMAEITLERLRTTKMKKYPSNTLTDYYDILHKLMEAVAILEGVKTMGDGAHQELIDLISKKEKLGEQSRQLLQQIRDFRNRVAYEGFDTKSSYLEQNHDKINEIIIKLSGIINQNKGVS